MTPKRDLLRVSDRPSARALPKLNNAGFCRPVDNDENEDSKKKIEDKPQQAKKDSKFDSEDKLNDDADKELMICFPNLAVLN